MTHSRVHRAVRASLGLVVTGAVVGAGVGVGVLAAWGLLADGPGGFPYAWFAFEFAAVTGAVLGGVFLPLVAWTLLPHVAFGRILVETALGTAIGAAIAIATIGFANVLLLLVGGFLGFGASVLQLRLRRPRATQLRSPTRNAT